MRYASTGQCVARVGASGVDLMHGIDVRSRPATPLGAYDRSVPRSVAQYGPIEWHTQCHTLSQHVARAWPPFLLVTPLFAPYARSVLRKA
eukprot:2891503-Rhodomonas_salina.1